MKAPKASGVLVTVSIIMSRYKAITSALYKAFTAWVFRRCTTSAGVPAGATSPTRCRSGSL
jgi:hypothetical protein